MANPANAALYSHRSQMLLENATTGSEIAVDRVQSFDPSFNIRTDPYYELARKGKIGSTQHPPEYRIGIEQNMTDSMEFEFVLAGKSLTAGNRSYNAGDLLTYYDNLTAWLLTLNNADTVMNELQISNCSVAELNYRFTVGGAMTQGVTLVGRTGKLYTANTPHAAFGALDDTSLGGIHGKDARVWFSTGSIVADRGFRLQNFNIRVAYPTVYVRELGNRNLAGTLADSPDVSADFDILVADEQPTEKFFTDEGDYFDYANPVTAFDMVIRVYDPTGTEGTTIIKKFKVENVLPVAHTPIRAQVRGLSTARYSLVMSKETTANSGGLIVGNYDF